MKNNKKMPRKLLGKMIKEAREKKKIEIYELADFMKKLKVNEKDIINWEKGFNFPNLDQIYKLAEILELNPNEMLDMKNCIQNSDIKEPNMAARRMGERILNVAEPGFDTFIAIMKLVIIFVVLFAVLYIHKTYENMDMPVVNQVYNTLDNALDKNTIIREDEIR